MSHFHTTQSHVTIQFCDSCFYFILCLSLILINKNMKFTDATSFFLSSSILIAVIYSLILLIISCNSFYSAFDFNTIRGIDCKQDLKVSKDCTNSPLVVSSMPA